jgi:hypothetical protein
MFLSAYFNDFKYYKSRVLVIYIVGRYDAVFALKIRFVETQKALTKCILCSSKLDERNEAEGIKKQIENYNFICTLVFNVKFLKLLK